MLAGRGKVDSDNGDAAGAALTEGVGAHGILVGIDAAGSTFEQAIELPVAESGMKGAVLDAGSIA